jgi:serine/threonine protein kinase
VLVDLSDIDTLELLAQAVPLGTGIGGSTARASIQGSDVFVKQLPLTALENDDPISTANRFQLPVACHYGIGSPGFGVGREIAAHQVTSNWVTSGVTDIFPTLYHWRVLDERCSTDVSEFEGGEARRQWGSYWPSVRYRVEALTAAPRSIVLFLEYVPDTLDGWLRQQFLSGDGGAAIAAAIEQIASAAAWMSVHGFQHLDVHERNILVRNGRLLFTDFGLALYKDFTLDQNEKDFFAVHGGYDHDTGISSLLHWVLAESGVGSREQRLEVLRAAACDPLAVELDAVRAQLGDKTSFIAQYAAIGVSTTTLFDELMRDASSVSYSSEFGISR